MAQDQKPLGDIVEIVEDTGVIGNWKAVEERMEKHSAPTLGQRYMERDPSLPPFFKAQG